MSPHRIALTFRQAEVGQLKISAGLEALLAPAMLPRGFPNMQLLQALKEVRAEPAPRSRLAAAVACRLAARALALLA
jgi:hypothetical protein